MGSKNWPCRAFAARDQPGAFIQSVLQMALYFFNRSQFDQRPLHDTGLKTIADFQGLTWVANFSTKASYTPLCT